MTTVAWDLNCVIGTGLQAVGSQIRSGNRSESPTKPTVFFFIVIKMDQVLHRNDSAYCLLLYHIQQTYTAKAITALYIV